MFRVGSATLHKVHELELNGFSLPQLLPSMDVNLQENHPDWFVPGTTSEGKALLSIHSWLIRHEGLTILIDTGAGNDKSRPQQMALDHLRNPFLENLAELGVSPEEVDYVLHTHIHSDHVGWNTRLVRGVWVPTFPNAIHICSRLEWNYGEALANGDEDRIAFIRSEAGHGDPIRTPVSGTFDDSMRPLATSGQLRLIDVHGDEVLPGIRFLPTPGHSIDHAAIEIISAGQTAIFGGDVVHHPVEVYDTELVSVFCEFPEATRRSRQFLLQRAVDTEALYLTAHFPLSSAGKVTSNGKHFCWTFEEN